MLGEGVAQVLQFRARGFFDLPGQREQLVRRPLCREDGSLEMGDALRALLELGHQLGDVIGERDRLGESLLLGPRRAQLRLQDRDVGLALRKLRGDLVADLGEHRLQDALAKDVPLEMVDQRAFDFGHRLVDGDRADGATALVVPRAAVAEDASAPSTERAHARRADRATTCATLRDAGQRVLRRGPAGAKARAARREALLHGKPDRIIDDAPFGQIDRDHLARVGLHADDAAALAHLLDPAMDVHAAIARVEEDRANGRRRPRAAPTSTGGRSRHALAVELVRDLLEAAMREVLVEDALDDRRLHLVDHRDRVAPSRAVALALQLVAEAGTTGDAAVANARAQCFAGARADRLELHLMTGALDKRGRLVDRVREVHLLPVDVIEEPATPISHEVAYHERHLDRVAAEARLIAAHDHVATSRIGEELTQARAREEVVSGAAIVDVALARLVAEAHARE